MFKNNIIGRTRRMNTRQFTVVIDVQSKKNQDGIVRIFLGPRVNNKQQLDDNRQNFVELDQFIVKMNQGNNIITRNSVDFKNVVGDPETIGKLYYRTLNFLNKKTNGNDLRNFNFDTVNNNNGFPHRLLLPKGTVGGQEYALFVMISDLENDNNKVRFYENMNVLGNNMNTGVNNGDSNESNNSNDSNDSNSGEEDNMNNNYRRGNRNQNDDNDRDNRRDFNNDNDNRNFNNDNRNFNNNRRNTDNRNNGKGNWGKTNGVLIHNYNNANKNVGNGNGVLDNRAMGFPFDRQIIDVDGFVTNNMFFKDVKVYHIDNNDNNGRN